MKNLMKLYRVTTLVREFSGCKDVRFAWFHSGEKPRRRPYADLIENYNPGEDEIAYAKNAVEELFTEDEAQKLKAYLDLFHGEEDKTTINEVQLPVKHDLIGVGAIPIGGGHDWYMLHKEPKYSLPFEVTGFFSLVGCELLDGSDVYHHRLFLLGKGRMQTNEEAAADQRLRPRTTDVVFSAETFETT